MLDSDHLDNLRGSGSIDTSIDDMSPYDHALTTYELLATSAHEEAFEPGKLNSGEPVEAPPAERSRRRA